MKYLLMTLSLMLSATSLADNPVELMRQFYKVADARPFDAKKLETFYAENFVDHDNHTGKPSSGAANAALFGMLASASPDSRHEITFIEPVGKNKALVRWRFKGTHTAPLFGAPAFGNKFDIAGMELWEFKDGKISGLWHVEELMSLFEQIAQKK